jgi:hypothetical protein
MGGGGMNIPGGNMPEEFKMPDFQLAGEEVVQYAVNFITDTLKRA